MSLGRRNKVLIIMTSEHNPGFSHCRLNLSVVALGANYLLYLLCQWTISLRTGKDPLFLKYPNLSRGRKPN